jgi:ribosome-binding protein aMBF1 (putative translation factor)
MRASQVACGRCGHTFHEHEGDGDGPYRCDQCECPDFTAMPADLSPGDAARQAVAALTTYAELADVLRNLPLLLREARRARGLSQREAARQLGVSMLTVARAERGENLVMSTSTRVLAWLDQTTQEVGRGDRA